MFLAKRVDVLREGVETSGAFVDAPHALRRLGNFQVEICRTEVRPVRQQLQRIIQPPLLEADPRQ